MRCVKVLEIIAEELRMPYDSSLSEILAAASLIDQDGEIIRLLVQAGAQDLIDRFKAEGIALPFIPS
jgi:hypothetical protein